MIMLSEEQKEELMKLTFFGPKIKPTIIKCSNCDAELEETDNGCGGCSS